MPIKRIVGRVRNDRAVSSLSSRLGDVLQRRRTTKVENQVKRISDLQTDEVVALPEGATPLTDLLDKSRMLARPARDSSYLHVSDLVGKCLRKIALVDMLGIPHSAQNLRLTDLLTFAQGDAIHDVLKANAVRAGSNAVWGGWTCKCGTTSVPEPCLHSEVDKDRKCPACKGAIDVYQEVPVRNAEYEVVGNPDLILYLREQNALHITELKSISHDAWKELVRPQPDHVIQVLFYWFLMREAGYRLTSKVSIMYATKGWIFSGSPVKEFVVDALSQVGRLQPYLQDAMAVKESRAGGELPPRICPSENAPDAKKCEVCRSCFGVTTDEKPITISAATATGARTTAAGRRRP